MEHIDCPHCGGTGKVAEDFLTSDHVRDVFKDYCNIFGYHLAYGVESYEETWEGNVRIKQDTSARSCYNCVYHDLPLSYFTRDEDKRRYLMIADKEKEDKKKQEAARIQKLLDLNKAEETAARLRNELKLQET